jgi:hypothetical protein
MSMASALASWVLMPWHALQVFSSAKSFTDNGVIGNERLNRRGLHVWRTRLAHALADRRRRALAHLVSAEDRAEFAAQGFVAKPGFLPPEAFEALVREVDGLREEAREMLEGDAVTRRYAVTPALLRRKPALAAFVNDPVFQGLTRYVSSFDAEPLVYVQVILAKTGVRPVEDPQTSLHMDTFHPTMKAWFFLHEVKDDEGPFTYVEGSHRLSPRRLAWQKRKSILASKVRRGGSFRLEPKDLPRLHWPQPRRFAVPGNTLVVGDTCGFHARAHSDKPTVRVEIYAYSRPNPFVPVTWANLGKLPFVGKHQVPIYWRLHDFLHGLGIGKPVWRKAGRIAPTAPVDPAVHR